MAGRFRLLLGSAALAVIFAAPPADAADTWTGLGGNNSWSDPANWDAAPSFPAALTFNGTTQLTSNNNEPALTVVNGFTFGTGAGNFTITGNAITWGGNIGFAANPAAATIETINLAMTLGANRTVATQNSGNVTLGGVISGSAGLIKTGNGTLTLNATNTYTGGTSVLGLNNLELGAVNALGNGTLTIGDGILAGNCRVRLNGYSQTITGLTMGGVFGVQGSVLEGFGVQGGTLSTLTIQIGSGTSSTNLATYLRDGAGTGYAGGKLAIVKTGAGTLDVSLMQSGNQGYTGGLTVNDGTLTYNSTSTIYGLGGGTITLGGGILNYSSNGSVAITQNLTLTSTTSSAMKNDAGTVTVLSAISGGGNLTKSGVGTLTLNATNTYTGTTTVSTGTLLLSAGDINSSSGVSVASGATFTNNSVVAFTKNLTLADGAVVSGSGAFTPSSLTITANLTAFTTVALGATSLAKDGNLELTLSGIADGNYTLFSGSAITGAFTSMTVGGVPLTLGTPGNFSGSAGGKFYTFTNSSELLNVVPEPATWVLLAFSLTTVMVFRRRSSQGR